MKKIVYLIISLFIFIPIYILADMSGPMIREYKATPKSPNGAPVYYYDDEKDDYVKTDEVLEFGKIITVDEESGILVCVDEECSKEVKLSDLVAVDSSYQISEDELSKEYDAIAITDLEIKKGPASAYESTGVIIKAGTKFKARDLGYVDDESKEFSSDEWNPYIYVNYNGTKGFVLSYEGTVGYNGKEETAITSMDIPLINPVTKKTIETIKANTIIKAMVYSSDVWSGLYYIEYNGKKGTVDNTHFIIPEKSIEFTALEKINIYDNLSVNDDAELTGKVIGTISKGTKFKSVYYNIENFDIAIRYENGNVKGWVYAELDDSDEPKSEFKGLNFEYPWDDKEEEDIEAPIAKPNKLNKMEIIYLCIGGAVLIALTATITLLLINKKKVKKNE